MVLEILPTYSFSVFQCNYLSKQTSQNKINWLSPVFRVVDGGFTSAFFCLRTPYY